MPSSCLGSVYLLILQVDRSDHDCRIKFARTWQNLPSRLVVEDLKNRYSSRVDVRPSSNFSTVQLADRILNSTNDKGLLQPMPGTALCIGVQLSGSRTLLWNSR